MAKKRVVLLIRRSPLNSLRASEGLRQGVGLTLADNDITVFLLDAAAWLAVPLSPEAIGGGQIRKHIDTLLMLKARVKVEAESLERYGIERTGLIPGIEVVSAAEVVSDITSVEAVICF